MEVLPGDQLVARLWRWDAERLLLDARNDHAEREAEGEESPDYSVSVFASEPLSPGEDVEEARTRLVMHVQRHRRGKYVAFTTRSRLEDAGFPLRLREPPPQHYDVVLGPDVQSDALEKLAQIIGENGKERFA